MEKALQRVTDEDAALFRAYAPWQKNLVIDSNVAAQETGLKVAALFAEMAPKALLKG